MKYIFKAPSAINLEITDACNLKCRHCYNFWREEGSKTLSMTNEMVDRLVEMFVEAGIFHVVLSGGEPMSRFDLLEYAIKKLTKNNISVSCNSNLMLATEDRIKRLSDAGLDHFLTSLNSFDPKTNDYLVRQDGAFERIINAIQLAVRNRFRISVNMIVSKMNRDQVYGTGKLCHDLGCQKIFGTRTVPSVNITNAFKTEFEMLKEDAIYVLDQLVKIKNDTGMMIGTLVSYPLCLLGDLERYSDFVGRGCPAQSGHVIGINANGEAHACVHEAESYGNVFKIGIFKTYENMIKWHDESYRYKGCEGCDYVDICQTGCRMSARAYHGYLNEADQLMQEKNSFIRPYKLVHDPNFYKELETGKRFYVPERLRFRKEQGFYLVNIRWANTTTVSNDVAEFLIKYKASHQKFTLTDFGVERKEILAKLYFKDAIVSDDIRYDDRRDKMGLSIDVMKHTD